jgi:anti-anti-sigma factor
MESQEAGWNVNVVTEVINGSIVVRVSGEIDMSNTSAIEGAVVAEVTNDAHGMVLDLSDVTYMDSAGIRLLYHLESRLGVRQQRLVIVVPPGSAIVRTLQAAGVIGSLALVSSVADAVTVAHVEERRETGPSNSTG